MDFNILYEYTRQGVRTLSELHSKQIAGAAARGLKWGVYCFSHAQTTERAE